MPTTLTIPSSQQTPRDDAIIPPHFTDKKTESERLNTCLASYGWKTGRWDENPGRAQLRSPGPSAPSHLNVGCPSPTLLAPRQPLCKGSKRYQLFEFPPQSYEEATVLSPFYSKPREAPSVNSRATAKPRGSEAGSQMPCGALPSSVSRLGISGPGTAVVGKSWRLVFKCLRKSLWILLPVRFQSYQEFWE